MDPVTIGAWIILLKQLAESAKPWLVAAKAGVDLKVAVRAARAQERKEVSAIDADLAERLIIPKPILKKLIEDIERATRRFQNRIDEDTLDEGEIQRARMTICKHLQKIRDFNGGQFPQGDFQQLWISWECQSRETARKAPDTLGKRKAASQKSKKGAAKRGTKKRPSSKRAVH